MMKSGLVAAALLALPGGALAFVGKSCAQRDGPRCRRDDDVRAVGRLLVRRAPVP